MEKSLSPILVDASLVTKKSKSGKEYTMLRNTYQVGTQVYNIDNFLSQDQLYILNTMLNQAD